jgi:hypothetical protein
MSVTDDQVAALRALLAGNLDEHQQRLAQLDRAGSAGYTALVAAAFFGATYRRFSHTPTREEIIDLVSDLRARSESAAEEIDPATAEALIAAAMGDDMPEMDGRRRVRTQILLLAALVAEAELDGAALDSFMADARTRADKWLAR